MINEQKCLISEFSIEKDEMSTHFLSVESTRSDINDSLHGIQTKEDAIKILQACMILSETVTKLKSFSHELAALHARSLFHTVEKQEDPGI